MKHVRFRDPSGTVRNGEWVTEGGDVADETVAGTGGEIRFAGRSYDPQEVDVLAPCEPTKIVCIGRNYAAHAAEFDQEVPDRPMLFLKPPSAVASHGSRVPMPAGKERVDYEAELGVVIGKQCRDVSRDGAADVVAGYTCVNDVSNRDDQSVEQNWVRGKAFDASAPLGPVIADPEHVPGDARVLLRQNGEVRQDASRADLFFDVPDLVAEITTYLTLEPGDVIATGTPEGVGPVADGDEIEIEIEGVGTLGHEIVAP